MAVAKRIVWSLTCAAMVSMGGASARADHAVPPVPRQIMPTDERAASHISLSTTLSRYFLDGRTGSLSSATLGGRTGLWRWLSVRAQLPIHRVDRDDAAGETGVGDLVTGLDISRGLSDSLRLGAAIDALWPTGNASSGLGHGALALASTLQLQWTGRPWLAYSSLQWISTVHRAEESRPDVALRRADSEGRASAGGGLQRARWRAVAEMTLQRPAGDDPDANRTFLLGGVRFDVRAHGATWMGAFADLPLRETRRIDWRVGLSVMHAFEAPHAHR